MDHSAYNLDFRLLILLSLAFVEKIGLLWHSCGYSKFGCNNLYRLTIHRECLTKPKLSECILRPKQVLSLCFSLLHFLGIPLFALQSTVVYLPFFCTKFFLAFCLETMLYLVSQLSLYYLYQSFRLQQDANRTSQCKHCS